MTCAVCIDHASIYQYSYHDSKKAYVHLHCTGKLASEWLKRNVTLTDFYEKNPVFDIALFGTVRLLIFFENM